MRYVSSFSNLCVSFSVLLINELDWFVLNEVVLIEFVLKKFVIKIVSLIQSVHLLWGKAVMVFGEDTFVKNFIFYVF